MIRPIRRPSTPIDRPLDVARLIGGAAIGGALVLLSLPPFGCGWLMWFALCPLFAVHERLRRPTLFAYGYLLATIPVAAIAFCVLAFSVAAFVVLTIIVPLAFAAGIVAATWAERTITHRWGRLLVFPAFAVVLEALLGSESVGVPVSLALSQAHSPIVIQSADIFGTASVTFLIVLVNRCWPILWRVGAQRRARMTTYRPAHAFLGLALLVVDLGYGTWMLRRHGDRDERFTVAAVQPVIATDDYAHRTFDPSAQHRIDEVVGDLTQRAVATNPDLVVLSEGGNGRFNFRIPELRRRFEDLARGAGAGFLVSSPDLTPAGELHNAIFSLDRDGRLLGTYRKRLLTPVGEEHVTRGSGYAPIASAIGPVGAMVCFESCFPSIARTLVRQGAEYLVVSTSDAPFRNSAFALLHSTFAVFRAIETRRYMIQASNTGPSLVVRPSGEIEATTSFLAGSVLTGTIGLRTDRTLFVRWGPLGPLCAVGWLAAALLHGWLSQHRRSTPALLVPVTIGPSSVVASFGYVAVLIVLASASVAVATHGTPNDRGPLRNLATFLSVSPELDVRAATVDRLQRESNTCGPAALAFVLNAYGVDVREEDLVRHVRLEHRGTNMLDLTRAAERYGVRAWGIRLNLAALRRERLPAIAYLPEAEHFVVVLGAGRQWIHLFDPARGAIRISAADFGAMWNGYLLQVGFPSIPDIDGASEPPTVATALPFSADARALTKSFRPTSMTQMPSVHSRPTRELLSRRDFFHPHPHLGGTTVCGETERSVG